MDDNVMPAAMRTVWFGMKYLADPGRRGKGVPSSFSDTEVHRTVRRAVNFNGNEAGTTHSQHEVGTHICIYVVCAVCCVLCAVCGRLLTVLLVSCQ